MYLEKDQIDRLFEFIQLDDDVTIEAVYYNLNQFEVIATHNGEKYALRYPMFHTPLTNKDIKYILKGEKDGN